MKKHYYSFGVIFLFLLSACQSGKAPISKNINIQEIRLLENEQTDYRCQGSIQVLKDSSGSFTFQDILQPEFQTKFQNYPDYGPGLLNYQYYWGKLRIENRMTHADKYSEWVLYFNDTWSNLDVYLQEEDSSWRQEQNGAFTSDRLKSFTPTAKGNLVKLILPPHEVVTIYVRGISERTATYPNFYTRLKHIDTYYQELLKNKVANALFIGFLLMMFLYNLALYFFGRDRSFILYSGYLLMVVIYSTFLSEDLTDWFHIFPDHPAWQRYFKLSLYLAMMSYLAFIRSFLNLKALLPTWDKIFKIFIYIGFPLIVLDIIILQFTNYSYEIEDKITVLYILTMIVLCCFLLYPLYKTKDKKGYFVIGGISAITIGAILTVISLTLIPPFSIFYLKGGTLIEIIIFSLGLAYRQREQKESASLPFSAINSIPSEKDYASECSDLPVLLIIEDNPDIITFIKSILARQYTIHTARNGNQGIKEAFRLIPDIIVSEVMMPEKNGFEVCQVLKKDERTSHIPFILLTAKASQAEKVKGLNYEADAFLTKPFDEEELLICLEKLVESSQQLQAHFAHIEQVVETKPSLDELFLQKLREQIQNRLEDAEFGVSQLAEAVEMSNMQIYRKLKALTGKTPSQFIRSYRLQKGLEILLQREYNISQIAYKVGFADPSYFSRMFQKEFGKSPSDCLK